jgi:hypothetical protein
VIFLISLDFVGGKYKGSHDAISKLI